MLFRSIKLKDKASFVAGHSLGEYSAACAAGVFSLSDTAKLLRTRGEAMQKAVPVGLGGMAAVIGVSYQDVQALAEACSDENNLCVAANDNADGQVVLSGHMAAIDKAVEIASEFGAKRCIKLPVSAPFHSPLMQPAAEVMAQALAEVKANPAQIPLIANVLAQPITDEKEIVKHLIEHRQMYSCFIVINILKRFFHKPLLPVYSFNLPDKKNATEESKT